MKHLKVLPLSPCEDWSGDGWMSKILREDALETYSASPRSIGRPGKYYDRYTKEAWFENSEGSWCISPEDFLYDLAMLNAEELRPDQLEGLRAICKCNLATPKQRQLLYEHRGYMCSREVYRDTRKFMLSYSKKDPK